MSSKSAGAASRAKLAVLSSKAIAKLVHLLRRRRLGLTEHAEYKDERAAANGDTSSFANVPLIRPQNVPAIRDDDTQSQGVDITRHIHGLSIRPLKRGYISVVHNGIWQSPHGQVEVAVKIMRGNSRRKFATVFLRELPERLHFDHPNIVPICGVYHPEDEMVALVTPWFDYGNIMDYLAAQEDLVHDNYVRKLELLRDALRGLRYLHERGVFHGNLKGSNVLISSSKRALLSDACFHIEPHDDCFVDVTKSIRWYPPELLQLPGHLRATASGDVWLFGGLAFEVLCGMPPHRTFKSTGLAFVALSQGSAPDQPPALQDRNDAWEFCLSCWRFDPGQRPSVHDLA
ncbi:kinase-like protein, partial [Auricularia subglabra TFB-10046 SS5]